MISAADLTTRERQRLRRAAVDMGLGSRWSEQWLDGRRRASPWLVRALADAIGRQPHEITIEPEVEYAVERQPDRETPGVGQATCRIHA